MVECSNGSFYTGWTTNPERRLKAHNPGTVRLIPKCIPRILVYVEKMESRHEAMIRETEIKKYSHAEKAAMSESWKKSTVSEDGTGKISRVNNWKIFRLFVPVCQRHR
jgi:putative endonuclease